MNRQHKYSRSKKRPYLSRSYWKIFIAISLGLGTISWLLDNSNEFQASKVWVESKVESDELISLPKDDAPHGSKMEWWYYNGHLETETGKRYSFHDTTFLVNNVMTTLVDHVSLTDYQTGKHYTDQRRSVRSLSMDSVNKFELVEGDWRMSGNNGVDKLDVSASDFSFKLRLISKNRPVFHGDKGVIGLGAVGSSYYYSRTRMDITGTIKINGYSEAVKGIAWFDHQWGEFSVPNLVWDWFAIQLDDGSDIMVYQLRNKENEPINYTASITQNGKSEIISHKGFSLIPNSNWVSAKTGISYPIEWHLKIPSKHIDVMATSRWNDSEFDSTLTTYNTYWEGAIQVTGSHTGKGFMELSGYKKNKQ